MPSLLRRQMEEIGKTLHREAWELRPASIDELLASALANYISEWSAQYRIEADCYAARADEVSEEVGRRSIGSFRRADEYRQAREQPAGVSIVIELVGATLRLLIGRRMRL